MPDNSLPPSITGHPQEGQTVTVQQGLWSDQPTKYAYEWFQCDSSGTNCNVIAAATGTSYDVRAEDVGMTLKVEEVASNATGDGLPARSDPSAVVVPAVPASTAHPSIWARRAGPHPDREPRHLVQQPDLVLVSVAALRRRGRRLRGHLWGH